MTGIHIFRKVVNVLVYLFFLSSTVYNLVGSSPHETYITPSQWVEYIWTAVHFLLGGFVIYQWFEPAHEPAIHGVGWHFVISVLLSAAWLSLLRHGHFIIGFIFVLLTASSVTYVFYRLDADFPAENWWDRLFVHAPFSLWHGWIVFSAVVNLFQIFSTVSEDGPGVWTRILIIIAFIFLTSTAVGYVEYKKKKGDVAGALVIGLGLLGVFTHQQDAWIHWTALTAAIITFLAPLRPIIYKKLRPGSDPATAPLLA